jgi:glutaredoxin 2
MPESEHPKLSLYHRNFCMFCSRVIHAIKNLDIDIDGKNIWQNSDALRELEQATGRATVPVLRIELANGEVTWMPESSDIVRYLSGYRIKGKNQRNQNIKT